MPFLGRSLPANSGGGPAGVGRPSGSRELQNFREETVAFHLGLCGASVALARVSKSLRRQPQLIDAKLPEFKPLVNPA